MTLPYDELTRFLGHERERMAKGDTVLYDRLGQSNYPIATTDAKIADMPGEAWIEERMRCLHCGLEWNARYVDVMEDLACPLCTMLAGSTVGEWDEQVEWPARQDLKHEPEPADKARQWGDVLLGLRRRTHPGPGASRLRVITDEGFEDMDTDYL